MGRRSALIVTVAFLVFVCHALVLGPLFYDAVSWSRIVNRPLVDRPSFRPGAALDGSTGERLTLYTEDRFAFRTFWLDVRARIDQDVFRQSPSPLVLTGAEWYYLIEELLPACELGPTLDAAASNLALLRAALTGAGVDEVQLLVNPQRAMIHPDPLEGLAPDFVRLCVSYAASVGRAVFAGLDAIDVGDALAAADPDDVLHHHDTHLTTRGTAVLAEALIDRLQPGLWDDDDLVEVGVDAKPMNLSRLLGVLEHGDVPLWTVRRPQVQVTSAEEWRVVPGSSGTRRERLDVPESLAIADDGTGIRFLVDQDLRERYPIHHFRTEGPVVEGRTVIIHDSTMWDLMPQIVPYFRDLTLVHFDHLHDPAAVASLTAADRVVLQAGYLDFYGMTDGSVSGGLLGRLADEYEQLGVRQDAPAEPDRWELTVAPIPERQSGDRAVLVVTIDAGDAPDPTAPVVEMRERSTGTLWGAGYVRRGGSNRVVLEVGDLSDRGFDIESTQPGVEILGVRGLVLRAPPGG